MATDSKLYPITISLPQKAIFLHVLVIQSSTALDKLGFWFSSKNAPQFPARIGQGKTVVSTLRPPLASRELGTSCSWTNGCVICYKPFHLFGLGRWFTTSQPSAAISPPWPLPVNTNSTGQTNDSPWAPGKYVFGGRWATGQHIHEFTYCHMNPHIFKFSR